jgi:hypothetical protein
MKRTYKFSPYGGNTRSQRPLFSIILFAAFLTALLASCMKQQVFHPENINAPLALQTSDSAITLNQANAYGTAVTFNWSTGSNQGTGSSIFYILEIGRKGDGFKNPVRHAAGTQVYTWGYTTQALNDSLLRHWKALPGTAMLLEARIVAVMGDSLLPPDTSNLVRLTVTSYKPVSSTLYITGDATPGGLDNSSAAPMTPDQAVPGLFHYQGYLTAGNFDLLTTLGASFPAYIQGADATHIAQRSAASQPDNPFIVADGAVYTVDVNLLTDTIHLQKLALPPFSSLWMVGDATPAGWNINDPDPMFRDPANPFVFKFDAVLHAGEFKIPTTTGNWGTAFYRPYSNHPPVADDSVQLVQAGGGPADAADYKWQIPAAGPYKIKLDLSVPSIHIEAFTPYTKLWLLGDATPTGWDINNPTPLIPAKDNPYVFTYTGPLSAGEFKIPVRTGDFGCDYFRPYANHPDISDTTAQFVAHASGAADADDYKWYIPSAGNYTIVFNQLTESIKIEKQ